MPDSFPRFVPVFLLLFFLRPPAESACKLGNFARNHIYEPGIGWNLADFRNARLVSDTAQHLKRTVLNDLKDLRLSLPTASSTVCHFGHTRARNMPAVRMPRYPTASLPVSTSCRLVFKARPVPASLTYEFNINPGPAQLRAINVVCAGSLRVPVCACVGRLEIDGPPIRPVKARLARLAQIRAASRDD